MDWNGLELFYRVSGKGRLVVLVHGFAEDGSIWQNQVPPLETTNTLIIPDLPGSGHSLPGANDWSIEDLADAVHAIIVHEVGKLRLETEGIILIGHSMGGYITLAFAEKYPRLLNAIGLFHSTAYPDSEEKKEARQKSIAFIRQHGVAKFIEQSTPNLFSPTFQEASQQTVNQIISQYSNFQAQSLVQYYEAMMRRPDRTHILRKIRRPVLFIMGKHDNAVPFDQSLQQSSLPTISFIHMLEHSGHMGMLEESEKCTQILQNFLKESEMLTL